MNDLQIAVVTDGLWRKSVSVIRALGKGKIKVVVLGDSWATAGFWSRFVARRLKAPVAAEDAAAFGQALRRAADLHPEPRVLYPMEEASLQYVSDHREELAQLQYRFLLPAPDALAVARDKGRTIAFAQERGIPAPRTFSPASFEDFQKAIAHFEPGHFVCKPTHGTGSAGVRYGDFKDAEEAAEYWKTHSPLVVQERIPAEGRAVGVSLLFDDSGSCVASFVHERIQQYPNSGGPSTDRVSITDDVLRTHSIRLLESLNWRGIAMVEWKLHPVTGRPALMEINPRFWGSLELAIRSGVNFPLMYHQICEGRSVEPVHSYKTGVRCRWLIPGDILRYMTAPAREPLLQFLRGLPGQAEEFDLKDLRGSVAVFVCTFLSALQPKYWRYLRRR